MGGRALMLQYPSNKKWHERPDAAANGSSIYNIIGEWFGI
jgi:hypothetical protein